MKRTFRSLLAAAGLAFIGLGALILPSQAQAVITCTGIDNSQPATNWPYNTNVVGCTNTTVSGQTALINAFKALQTQAPDLWTKFQTTKPQVYLFRNVADYDSYFNAHPTLPHPAAGSGPAFTYSPNTPAVPQFTIVFEDRQGLGPLNRLTTNAGVHELGHWADYIYRALASQVSRASDGLVFQDQIYFDYLAFNLAKPCAADSTGLFNQRLSPSGSLYCSGAIGETGTLIAPFAGLTNKAVLQQAWGPQLTVLPKENWSEAFAVITGNLDGTANTTQDLDYFYSSGRFTCSKLVVSTAVTTGAFPTVAALENAGCYKVPTVTGSTMPSGLLCTLVEQGTTFGYPYKSRFGQYVYCGATPATYKFGAGGDNLQNMPGDVFGTSYMKNRFQTNNVTLYVFRDYLDAQARLGAAALPADIGNAFKYGAIQETAGVGSARTKFIVVFERVKDGSGNWVAVPSQQFSGALMHYAGRMVDFLSQRFSGSFAFTQAYIRDRTDYNAKPTCQVLSFMCVNNVVVAPYNQAPYAGKSNLERLLIWRPEYTKYFMDSEVAGQYRGLIAEEIAIRVLNSGENLNGVDTYLNSTTQFGKCTFLYSKALYDTFGLPTAADLTANNCP